MLNNASKSNTKIYDYSEYNDIPEKIRCHTRDAENHLKTGISMLELFDNRFATPRNIKDIKNILSNYFDIQMTKLASIKIYVGEYEEMFVSFSLFKIKVNSITIET